MADHGQRAHSRYSASSAERFFNCALSVRLSESLPERPAGPAAEEGTKAHELLDECLKQGQRNALVYAGRVLTAHRGAYQIDMCVHVQEALDFVYGILDSHPGWKLISEQRFFFPQAIVPRHDCGGTTDIILYNEELGEIYVIDFKYGYNLVEAHDNKQGLMYATAGAYELNLKFNKGQIVIVQPRAFHPTGKTIRSYPFEPVRLIDFITDTEKAIRRCEAEDATATAGAWCRYCNGAPICPETERLALEQAGRDFASYVHVTPETVLPPSARAPTPDQMAAALDAFEIIEAYIKNYKDYVYNQALSGVYIPGRKLVEDKPKRRWNGDEYQLAQLLVSASMGLLSIDDVMPRQLLALTNAEKLLKAAFKKGKLGKPGDAVNTMAELTLKDRKGNLTLVPSSDERPAANTVDKHYDGVTILPPS